MRWATQHKVSGLARVKFLMPYTLHTFVTRSIFVRQRAAPLGADRLDRLWYVQRSADGTTPAPASCGGPGRGRLAAHYRRGQLAVSVLVPESGRQQSLGGTERRQTASTLPIGAHSCDQRGSSFHKLAAMGEGYIR